MTPPPRPCREPLGEHDSPPAAEADTETVPEAPPLDSTPVTPFPLLHVHAGGGGGGVDGDNAAALAAATAAGWVSPVEAEAVFAPALVTRVAGDIGKGAPSCWQ